ncbi:MAG: hypothetical protein PHR35_22450, partial [Kiritimatiellae bacterium]|nr:hypothetical protein [Kiritimatiellia bacterium]
IVYALEKYLKESGDFDLLEERIPYVDEKQPDTVFGHACRAMVYLWKTRGAHGLCLLGCGDWLDSLNNAGVKGKGESVWLSIAFCYALREMEHIAQRIGQRAKAGAFSRRRAAMADIVNRRGWDGNWYLMAFSDEGVTIGSARNKDGGKMFLNPQSWAVLADVADPVRTRKAMEACEERLRFEIGYLCFAPMYSRYDESVGRISLWPSEGGSVYTHAATFKIAADCKLGEGDRAWETLRRIVPASGVVSVEVTSAEPMAIPNAYMGPQWPQPGATYQGLWTASADWVLQIMVEEMFGAKADYDGLVIAPCLPSAMTEARVERHFRGSVYDIRIAKPAGICRGEVRLRVDGRPIEGSVIAPDTRPGRHVVEAMVSALP